MLLQKQNPLHLLFPVNFFVVCLAQTLGALLGKEIAVENALKVWFRKFSFAGKNSVQPASVQSGEFRKTADAVTLLGHDSFKHFTEL